MSSDFDPNRHLMKIGKSDYLNVAWRLVWFREEHPEWGIETEIINLDLDKQRAIVKATIRNDVGEIMAQAHKMEDVKGFADYLEKAETSSIGRALAMCGYGTQFAAAELDEGDRLADSPVNRAAPMSAAGNRPPGVRRDAPVSGPPQQQTNGARATYGQAAVRPVGVPPAAPQTPPAQAAPSSADPLMVAKIAYARAAAALQHDVHDPGGQFSFAKVSQLFYAQTGRTAGEVEIADWTRATSLLPRWRPAPVSTNDDDDEFGDPFAAK